MTPRTSEGIYKAPCNLFKLHSTLIIEAMKVTLVLCSSLALCLACPDVVPVDCGVDMMNCPGLMDAAGCQMPDTCMPTKGGT